MTIAACYVTPEGVVLGADSTASVMFNPGGFHYFNNAQKLFEIGENSTLGILTWGMGGLVLSSHRWMIAQLADGLKTVPAQSVQEVAERWRDRFWIEYTTTPQVAALIQRCQSLNAKPAYDSTANNPAARNQAEELEFQDLRMGLVAGFCVAGHVASDRKPAAFTIIFDPLAGQPNPQPLAVGNWGFWGAPNMIQRLMFGCDQALQESILKSGKWGGTPADLQALVQDHHLLQSILPIREAVDFVHSCIASTIKALKFSSLTQICGGPIEIAVITSDRQFRWVRHKPFDAAITEGEI